MPSAFTSPNRFRPLAASLIALAAVAMPAAAGPRKGVEIVYMASTPEAPAPKLAQAVAPSAPVDKSKQRIEFRYPGQAPVQPVSAPPAAPYKPLAPVVTEVPQGQFDAGSAVTALAAPVREPTVQAAPLQPMAPPAEAKPIPKVVSDYAEAGIAVIYGDEFAGLPTANGEIFNQADLSAAHPSLPLPSLARVTNPATGRQVVVRVNDRGPFEDGAQFQLSRGAAQALGFEAAGQANLTFEYLGPAGPQPVAPRPESQNSQPKALVKQASVTVPVPEDELLGGDELVGGAGWSASPAPAARNTVVWPEPPSDWDVTPKSKPQGDVYVQLASFSDRGNANALYRDLQSNLPVEIVPARVNGTDYYRVRVGPFNDRSSAQQLRDRLDAEGKGNGRVVSAE